MVFRFNRRSAGPARRYSLRPRRTVRARFSKKSFSRLRRKTNFSRRVVSTMLRKDPVQYRMFSTNSQYEDVSQTPKVLLNLSNVKFNNENSNLKYCRTAPKIKVMNLNLCFSVYGYDQPFNQVSFAIVRHKRSGPIINADIQGTVTGALTTEDDKPFLPSSNDTLDNTYPNELGSNMTGISGQAFPMALNMGWNPKVVQVIKRWDVVVQPQSLLDSTATDNRIGVTYPAYRQFEWNWKVNEVWKYQNTTSADDQTESYFPYNNKCYHLIAWSDSRSGIPNTHPTMRVSARMSFKDLD